MKKICIFISAIFLFVTPVFSETLMEVIEKVENNGKKILGDQWTVADIEKRIEKCKVSEISESDSNGNTTLHHLVMMNGTAAMIEKLLDKYSSQPDIKTFIDREFNAGTNAYPTTALLYCLDKKKYEIAKILINHGADVNTILRFNSNYEKTPLWICLFDEKKELVKLLIEKGADVNKTIQREGIQNCTPIYYAVEKNLEDYVTLLVEGNADVNKEVYNKKLHGNVTPLWAAIEESNNNIALILIKNNADINKTVNNEDYTDRSLLYFCVEKKNIQLAKALIDQGCDVN